MQRAKLSKHETKEKIQKFFIEIKNKTPKEIKKIKKISKNQKVPLKENKKLFCKDCLTPFKGNEKIRIKKDYKTIKCAICEKLKRIYLSKKLQTA